MALSPLSPVSGYPSVCATISCLYCKAVLSFSGLPAVRYADHLSQEHRILFEQDEIITRTIQTQLKGLLPPAYGKPSPRISTICSVDIERKPQIMLRHRHTLKSYSSQTQTENFLQDAFSQTISDVNEKVLTLDVAVQTLENYIESGHSTVEDIYPVKKEEESQSTKEIQDLLEAAMVNRVNNEYPCKICQKKFSSLYDVKSHLIESHKENNHDINLETHLPSIATQSKKKKVKKIKKSKLTAKKKPWCKYCWIKFKDVRQYQLHNKALHQNLTPKDVAITTSEKISHSVEGELKTVSLYNKEDEGEEIVDRQTKTVETIVSKSPVIKYQRGESKDRNLKRKRISLTPNDETTSLPEETETNDEIRSTPIKAIKLIKNKDNNGYTTLSSNKGNLVQSSKTPSQDLSTIEDQGNERDPEVHFPYKSNPSVDNLTISRNRPIRQRNDRDLRKEEILAECAVPIKDLRVILTERVEKEKHIDPSGVYICTELDKLGVSMEDFHAEMDQVFPQVNDMKVEEHQTKDKLPWYEARVHQCLLCSSTFAIGNLSYHLHDVHTTTLHSYKTKFPEADLKVPAWRCKVCSEDVKWMGPSIRSHLRASHQLNLETYLQAIKSEEGLKDSSLPWFEYKVIKCNICQSMMSLSNLRDHLRVGHSMSEEDYKQRFPAEDLNAPLFECKVCGEKVSWTRRSIQKHLTGHDLTLQSYADTHHHHSSQEEETKFPQKAALVTKIKVEPGFFKTEETVTSGSSDIKPSDNNNKEEPTKVAGQKSRRKPWYESKLTTCLHCSKQFWHGKFIKHLHSEHSQSIKLYRACFPSASLAVGQYICLICGASLAHYSSPISGHLTSKHGITLTEYYKEYQCQQNKVSTQSTNDVKFKCKICQTETDCAYDSIKKHLLMHGLSWAKYQTYDVSTPDHGQICQTDQSKPESSSPSSSSAVPKPPPLKRMPTVSPATAKTTSSKLEKYIQLDPFYNRCKWTCLICYKVFSSGFWRHVNETHFLKKEEYLHDYGRQGIMIVNYSCQLCDKKIPWTGITISNHLKQDHNIGLLEYDKNFGKKEKTNKIVKQPISNSTKNEKWFNGSEYQCQLCFKTMFSMAGLTSHLKEAHSRKKYDYFKEFDNKGITIKHYQCKICASYFPWTGVSISKHLRLAHTLSLSQYSVLHENPGGKKVNTNSTPSVSKKDNSNAEQGKSVISSEKWYNKCQWTCQICGRVDRTNSSVFFKHVAQDHKMSVEEYKDEFGTKGVLYSDHTCQICYKKVPQNGLSLCKHLKHSHQLSLKEYEDKFIINQDNAMDSKHYSPSDESWYNKCYWLCNICGNKNRSLGSSKKHIQQIHHITYEEYFSAYGNHNIHEVDFTCSICSAVMSCNGVTIANHMINSHRLSLADYESRHIQNESSEEVSSKRSDEEITPTAELKTSVEGNLDLNIKQEVEEEIDDNPQNNNDSYSKVSRDDRPWYQQCLYVCQLCGCSYFSTSALNNHCRRNHNLERDEYIAKFGDTGKFIEHYTCKICNKVFKCEGKALGAHLASVHKLSLEQYSAAYEPDRNSQLNPTLDNEYYQIELNDDQNDVSTEVDPLADDEEHFQIVSIESLNLESNEEQETFQDSSFDDQTLEPEEMEQDEESPDLESISNVLLPSNSGSISPENLEFSNIEGNIEINDVIEEEDNCIADGNKTVEGNISNEDEEEDEEEELDESIISNNNFEDVKKIHNIRDIFDSDSDE